MLYAADLSPRSSTDSGAGAGGRRDEESDEHDSRRGTSVRPSIDVTPLPTTANGYASVAGGQSTGLSMLPMGSPEQRSTSGPSAARKRPSARAAATSSGSAGAAPGQPVSAGDLSNLKLARNQEALSAQIDGLREVVESQGRLVGRLLEALEHAQGQAGSGRAHEGVI